MIRKINAFFFLILILAPVNGYAFWGDWVEPGSKYGSVSIVLDPFIYSDQRLIYRVPKKLQMAVNNGIHKIFQEYGNIKKVKVKMGEDMFLNAHKTNNANIKNFYKELEEKQERFLISFCKENKVDFLFMWDPDPEIDHENNTVELELFVFYPKPALITSEPLILELDDWMSSARTVEAAVQAVKPED